MPRFEFLAILLVPEQIILKSEGKSKNDHPIEHILANKHYFLYLNKLFPLHAILSWPELSELQEAV